ncbi:MAG: PEGA domain-containing protein, partial [Planctomycetota bacterium]|nr:PEGA domain-containing protein [Planctomycetota bacterium]
MSVKGDLAYQGLEQLLRADLAGKGGGRLTLRHGAHYAALHLDEAGLYVLSPDLLEPATLLEAFVERGLLDREVLTRLGGGPASAIRVLDQLVADGTLPEAQLLETLALEIEDTVVDMLLWEEGAYHFETGPLEASGTGLLARICVDPVGVAERALTRLDERRDIGDRLGDHALLFEPIAGELPALQGPGDRLHEIYARIDGRTIVHEMALRMGISRFEVLSGIARLAEAGLARPVTSDHLSREATERAIEGRHAVARALALQWAETDPEDISPLRKLGSLAQEAGDKNAELEALCAQGNLFIQQGEHGQALDVFTRAMRQSPADDVVLAGMRLAAEAAGDSDALVDGTLLTAQTKLDEGQPAVALEMLDPLIASHPSNMAVHLLRARALVQSEKRTEFFEQAEAIGQVLSRDGVKSATDREVAEFFRETIAHLAPDRGDLLERFRSLYDPRLARRRAMAMLGALVLVLCGAGVYFWPASASSLLSSAQEAADGGDKQTALEMIGQLVDRFPESPEAEQAYRLQALLVPPAKTINRKQKAMQALKKDLLAKVPALQEALTALPDQAAQATLRSALEPLQASRRPGLAPTAEALGTTAERLQAAVLERVQVLAETAGVNERLADDAIGLREFIDKAERLRDPSWMAEVKGSSELLYGLAKLHGDRVLIVKTQELARATLGLDKAAAYYDGHITSVRLRHAQREIDEADRRCREDAPKLMVSGHLDQADACYARLETLLERYSGDDTYGRLVEGLQRRQLPQLIEDRRAQIEDIRGRLAAAQAAEDAGDLTKAVGLYASLVKEYWLIRFENVCTLPLRVETTPPGARVYIEDIEVGRTPTIVRYAWGSKTSVRVEAEGFVTVTQSLHTAEDDPPTRLHMALAPAPVWSAPTSPRTGTQPLDVAGDILTSDRRGLVSLHARTDGSIRWTRDLSSLEGVRARPALA